MKRSINYFGLVASGTVILFFLPLILNLVVEPVSTVERWSNLTEYYQDPDYFTIEGNIVDVNYLEPGNWLFRSKTTQVQLDSGHIILVKGWETGIILTETYEFGYEKNMDGEYDLDYPDYVKHIE